MRRATSPLAVTWAGHATVLVELDGARLLTDPVLSDRVGPLVRTAAPVEVEVGRRLDAVLLSHMHADHAHLRSLRMLEDGVRVLAPSGSGDWLRRHGVSRVTELRAGEQVDVGVVRVSATPARHDARRWPLGVRAEPMGFLIEGTQCCYFAGDTDLFAGLAELAGRVDLALLPVWGWGPSVGSGHLDPERAVIAAQRIAPRVAVPIHWGTLSLPWRAARAAGDRDPALRFSELARSLAPSVQVRILAPGERTEVGARL